MKSNQYKKEYKEIKDLLTALIEKKHKANNRYISLIQPKPSKEVINEAKQLSTTIKEIDEFIREVRYITNGIYSNEVRENLEKQEK